MEFKYEGPQGSFGIRRGLHWDSGDTGYIGIMENKLETIGIIQGLYSRVIYGGKDFIGFGWTRNTSAHLTLQVSSSVKWDLRVGFTMVP